MKYVSVIACLLFSINTLAARSPRLSDEVAKIAVGPEPTRSPAAESSDEGEDPTDAVDKPIRKPKVIVTDAPADQPAVATKATNGHPVRDESSNAVHGITPQATEPVDAAESDAENSTAKIDTSKPKSEILKPSGPVPAPVRVQKPGKVAPTIDALPAESAALKVSETAPSKTFDGVSPEQSLKWLENGNTRYVTKKFRADGRSEKERANKSAKPHAIVLACSDSRVPPELIFDQGLGEITTIRTAGEVLDLSVIASIEQTIINDHPRLLIVLGHTDCSAVEKTLTWKDTATFGSDALDRMVSEIKPHLKTAGSTKSPGLQIEAALQADGVARDLPEHSAVIKKAVDSGELKIRTGLYWIDTGKVKFY